jgi:RNA polymerase sigma-70 factor (ECF subfamily)
MYHQYGFTKKNSIIEEENYFEDSVNTIEYQFSADDIQSLIDGLPEGYRFSICMLSKDQTQGNCNVGINEGTLSRSYHMRERFCNNRLSH